MSQNKLKEMNGNANANSNSKSQNGSLPVENGNDLNTRKAALTPLEFRVTQQRETERPFSNKYNKFWEAGTYHCVVCDAELFRSETKFESKSGWPAFYNVVDPKRVKLTADLSHIGANLLLLVAKPDLARTEVSCANCNAHLGHLFKDGPKPTGLRYCINSASLNFKSETGDSTDNGLGLSVSTNGNGIVDVDIPIREFICKPENTCSRPATTANTPVSPTPTRQFCGRSAREQFFSSIESNVGSLPPMGALCLNNQSCQRISTQKPTEDNRATPRRNVISNGAENNVNCKLTVMDAEKNANSSKLSVNDTANNTDSRKLPTRSAENNANGSKLLAASNIENNVHSSKLFSSSTTNGTATTPTSNIVTTPVTSKSKNPFSKGASLTAARINFFQKISAKQDSPSPSRWATTFNAKWSSNKSSSPLSSNNTLENQKASNNGSTSVGSNSSICFPNSCSSGSLSTVLQQQPKLEESSIQPRRSTSGFFSNSQPTFPSSVSVQQISTPPRTVALRETTL